LLAVRLVCAAGSAARQEDCLSKDYACGPSAGVWLLDILHEGICFCLSGLSALQWLRASNATVQYSAVQCSAGISCTLLVGPHGALFARISDVVLQSCYLPQLLQ
jgi:hypothetical protein